MGTSDLTREQILEMLRAGPSRVAELTAALTPVALTTRPTAEEWSVNDLLAHMRACADVWGDHIATMLREDHPRIRAISPRTWIRDTDYPDRAYRSSLRDFSSQRDALLALLEPLSPDRWERGGTFTGADRGVERTVRSQAARLAVHEQAHLIQISEVADAVSWPTSPTTPEGSAQ